MSEAKVTHQHAYLALDGNRRNISKRIASMVWMNIRDALMVIDVILETTTGIISTT